MEILFKISVNFLIFSTVLNSPTDSLEICKSNMDYYKQEHKIVCDCVDTYLYHEHHDECYNAYRQGPCPEGHYFILVAGEKEAKCEKNPCNIDGLVPFNGKCHFLWRSGNPCKDNDTYLGINKDYQIQCGSSKYSGSMDSLKSSKSCPENTYLLPTDENNTNYSCECKETFLFSKQNSTCYKAYRQGPCPEGYYFIFPPMENEPRCEKNPCHDDGLVPFKNGCHHIYKKGTACSDNSHELTVTEKDFQLICTHPAEESKNKKNDLLLLVNYFGPDSQQPGIINPPTKTCPPGSRRHFLGCKRIFN